MSLQSFRFTDKRGIKWSKICVDTLPLCMFLRLRLYFAEVVYLVGLTYLVADHVKCDNYATTYTEK